MSMRMIDLMPTDIRARAQAGQRLRRAIGVSVVLALVVGAMTTWARVRWESQSARVVHLEALAERALDLEAQAQRCNDTADAINDVIADYETVAMPMPVSSLLAGIVESLPRGGTLETLALDYDDGVRAGIEDAGPRLLSGTVEGYAASDEDVATLARRLTAQAPFEDVRLETSRSRTVRGHPARGFTLSFTIHLDRRWIVQRPEDVDQDASLARIEEMSR